MNAKEEIFTLALLEGSWFNFFCVCIQWCLSQRLMFTLSLILNNICV